MKKRFLTVCLLLAVLLVLWVPAFATDGSRFVDMSGLVSSDEAEKILARLDEISEEYGMDVVIVTADSLYGKTAQAYADDYYDYNGYSYNGILLLVSIDERDWAMSTKGDAIYAFTDYGLSYMSDSFVSYLSNGDYADGFLRYADLCEELLSMYRDGNPLDSDYSSDLSWWYEMSFGQRFLYTMGSSLIYLVIALAVAFIIALIVTGIMKGKLKSVHAQSGAADYIDRNNSEITEAREFFLYRTVSRTPRPKENNSGGSSTHTSSSGATHGGSSGKF